MNKTVKIEQNDATKKRFRENQIKRRWLVNWKIKNPSWNAWNRPLLLKKIRNCNMRDFYILCSRRAQGMFVGVFDEFGDQNNLNSQYWSSRSPGRLAIQMFDPRTILDWIEAFSWNQSNGCDLIREILPIRMILVRFYQETRLLGFIEPERSL